MKRLPVLVREVRCGDGVASRELKIYCKCRDQWLGVQQCTGCAHCQGFSLDPTGRRSTLECAWDDPSKPEQRPAANDSQEDANQTPITAIMTKDVVCVTDDLGVEELTRLFLDRGISGVPVVDESGRAVGVVSKTDLVRQNYEQPEQGSTNPPTALQLHEGGAEYELGPGFHDVELSNVLVRDIMTPVAYTLKASTPIAQAAALMAFEGIHRLPITADGSGEIVGLLSALDVLRWLGEQHAYLRQRETGEDIALA